MPKFNQKKLADAITRIEGKKVSVNRAQVGEVQGWVLDALAVEFMEGSPSGVIRMLEDRYSDLHGEGIHSLACATEAAEHASGR